MSYISARREVASRGQRQSLRDTARCAVLIRNRPLLTSESRLSPQSASAGTFTNVSALDASLSFVRIRETFSFGSPSVPFASKAIAGQFALGCCCSRSLRNCSQRLTWTVWLLTPSFRPWRARWPWRSSGSLLPAHCCARPPSAVPEMPCAACPHTIPARPGWPSPPR